MNVPFIDNETLWREADNFRSSRDLVGHDMPPIDVFYIIDVIMRFDVIDIPDLQADLRMDAAIVPGAWEVFYFDNTGACDPLADGDHDHLNNYQEFIAGTNPKDPSSVLRLAECADPNAGDGVVLSWPSASNKLYIVERTTNLVTGFQAPLESGLLATPPLNTYTDTTVTATGPYFYRIRLNTP